MQTPIKDRRRVVVRVSRSATIDMLVAAIESAVVPPLMLGHSEEKAAAFDQLQRRQPSLFQTLPLSLLYSKIGLPVCGILFGREIYDLESVTFVVERMFVASANRHDFGLWPNPHSPGVMAEVAEAAGLGYEVIGDFRSRPRLEQTPKEIDLSRDYQWKRDKKTIPEFEGDRVSILMTITGATGEAVSALPEKGSVVRFPFNKWQIWIAAMLRDRQMPTQGPDLAVETSFF